MHESTIDGPKFNFFKVCAYFRWIEILLFPLSSLTHAMYGIDVSE